MLFLAENEYRKKYGIVAGVDEAGRGPLAGPLVVAACILPENAEKILEKLNDSKKMTANNRQETYELIIGCAEDYQIRVIEPAVIDALNILQATLKGMKDSLENLRMIPDYVLFDGNRIPSGISCKCSALVKGDGKVACIAAASVLAKVTRDRIMTAYHDQYPHYNFAQNKGYPTPEHLSAISRYGICELHRLSYKPVRDVLGLDQQHSLSLE